MAFVPNINRLRSNFSMRGDFLRNDFATRYGGAGFAGDGSFGEPSAGGFAGSSQATEVFKSDAGDMVKKVVKTDTKKINDQIASSLSEKIKEEIKKETPTYAKPDETTAFQGMSMEQLQEFVSNMQSTEQGNQASVSKTTSTKIDEDSTVKNAAAALRATEGFSFSQLQNPFSGDPFANISFDPTQIQSILDASKSGDAPKPPTQETPKVSQEFNNMVGEIFGKKEDVPEDYKLSKMDVTYTKVEDKGQDDDYDEIDSVDVTGRVLKEDDDFDEIDSVDVTGRGARSRSSAGSSAAAPSMSYSDDPWERFKMLYLDFYGGGMGDALYRELYQRERGITSPPAMADDDYEDIGSVDVVGKPAPSPVDDDFEEIDSVDVVGKTAETPMVTQQARPEIELPRPEEIFPQMPSEPPTLQYQESDIIKDTNDILRAQDENAQLTDMSSILADLQNLANFEPPAPVIINNNRTITATPMDESRTERVFSDDSTFNRLSFADSDFPRSFGGFF